MLMRDPSSWVQAAVNEWAYPVDRNWITLTQVYDLLAVVNSKNKPKPYPVPWPKENTSKLGSKNAQKRSDVISKLDQMNPKETDGV